MSSLWPPLLVFFVLCASAAVGFFVNGRLPERHRTPDSIDLVHLAIGLLVTFTAIVLGLLTSSVKTGFETAYQARGTYAGELAQLDRCLRDYGPETQATRAQLRSYVAAVIASTWPNEAAPQGVAFPDTAHMRQTGEDPTLANVMNDIGVAVRSLEPTDAFHRAQAAACAGDYADVVKSRWAVIEGLHGVDLDAVLLGAGVLAGDPVRQLRPARAAERAQRHRHRDVRRLGQLGDLRHPRSRRALWRPVRRAERLDAPRARRHDAVSRGRRSPHSIAAAAECPSRLGAGAFLAERIKASSGKAESETNVISRKSLE